MEIDKGPMQAATEEERTKAERRARMSRLLAEVKEKWERKTALFAEEGAARKKRLSEGASQEEEEEEEEEVDDHYAVVASEFRDTWNRLYSGYFGSFEDTTKIPNKRFTYMKPGPHADACPQTTLQVFSLKVTRLRGGLQWPLQVFGMVAIRDCVDHNRNIIFHRPRDSCQILTREVPYLKLMGPTRAVVVLDPAYFEVDLKVKGATESEDQWLSFLAVTYRHFSRFGSHLLKRDYASKLSTLEFELGSIVDSVEATIDVRITDGSWPDGFRAQFAAGTTSIGGAEIILLDCGDDKVPVAGYARSIKLSRCVASVEVSGQLRVSVRVFQGDKIVHRMKFFKPKTNGVSIGSLDVGYCTLGFTISWSVTGIRA